MTGEIGRVNDPSLAAFGAKDAPVKYAGFWIRLWALLLDTLLFGVPALILMFAAFPASSIARAWIIGVENALFLAYWIWFQAANRQTLGKRAAGIKVVTVGGGPLAVRAALLRNLWCVYGLVKPAADIYALCNVSPTAFALAAEKQRGLLMASDRPHWYGFALLVLSLWWFAELVSLIRSREKRSVHDFLGGTAVVYV